MMLSICHRLSNSQMYQWKIAVRLSNSLEFWYKDRRITIFMARGCDVRVEGGTLTQITRLLIDLFEMPKRNISISLSLGLSVLYFLSPPPSGSLTFFHSSILSTTAAHSGLLSQFTPNFPIVVAKGEILLFFGFFSQTYWVTVAVCQ